MNELIKVLEVRFVKGVSDDFDVQVVQVLSGQTVSEVWRYQIESEYTVSGTASPSAERREHTKWGIHQHAVVELLDIRGNTKGWHGVEHSKGMTPVQ